MEIRADLISRAYVLAEYDRQHKGPPGGARKIIEDAPAVDAIPVEWLEARKTKYYEDWGLVPVSVEEALTMWQKEQEART